ncbi:MAG: M20/M25/M40 family metallo-hydrolase [Candidatus Xenobia bacterium]
MFDESSYEKAIDTYIQSSRQEFEDRLRALVETPTVSCEPDRKADVARGAQLAARMIQEMGGTAEVMQTAGHPIVIGQMGNHPGAPTLTVYNHIDVQPADAAEWEQKDPFKMTIDGDRYGGRGTTDDKGPALTVLMAARYAAQQGLPLNVRFLWELEEEIGSPSFDAFLKQHAGKIATDSVVVSDTVWISRDRPAIPYGLRGLLGMIVRLETGVKSTHSGTTGGVARNPIGELCDLIAQCYEARTGQVKIPGFYDAVRPLSKEELAGYAASGFDLARFQKVYGFKSIRTGEVEDALRRIMAQPTFEVHGLVGGYTGPGVKTIVPHTAEAKISMRLVPDMDGDQVFKLVSDYMKKLNPDVQIEHEATLPPWIGNPGGPYNQAAVRAVEQAFGKPPVFTREGGSIGAILSMENHLKCPVVFIGLSLPEHGYHEPNENYDWGQASGGMKLFALYLRELATMKAGVASK